MLNRGMSKAEIEKEIANQGDFVQIDHLSAFLKEDIPTDIRKFVMTKIAFLYEKNFMFGEAGKIFNNIALLSTPFSDKIKAHLKEAELYIRAGSIRDADYAVDKAMKEANTFEKNDITFNVKQFYRRQAEAHEKGLRRNNALKMYEKLYSLSQTEAEKAQVRPKLLELYEKLGKFREFNALKGKS